MLAATTDTGIDHRVRNADGALVSHPGWVNGPEPAGYSYDAPGPVACPSCGPDAEPMAVTAVYVTGGRYGVIWLLACHGDCEEQVHLPGSDLGVEQ